MYMEAKSWSVLSLLHSFILATITFLPANEVFAIISNILYSSRLYCVIVYKYNDDSLIFTISFKDTDQNEAVAKLHAVYLTAFNKLKEDMSISNLTLIDTENIEIDFKNNIYKGVNVSVDNGLINCVIIGFLVGLVISIGIALIAFVLDNTIHDKDDFEQMTGISVIAYIEKVKKANQKA